MEIVIKIPKDSYEATCNGCMLPPDIENVVNGIKNGVVLPENYGDLIDRTKLYNQTSEWEAQALEQVNRYNPEDSRDEWRWWSAVLKERGAFKHDVADAPTIVEADKGVLEKINEKQDSLRATCKAWDEAIEKDGYVN